jgi:hypothetical protein
MGAYQFFDPPREALEDGIDAEIERELERKAIELYGGPEARHGFPPLTYAELSAGWKREWLKLARSALYAETRTPIKSEPGK